MQYHIQTLVKHLFDKDSFEQVTVQELKEFSEAYPYAAVGQFLYAKKLYEARSWNYYEQTEQASLYFHNPLWYRWLMDQKYEAPPVQQRQEEQASQNAFRVVVQMPKGVPVMSPSGQEGERETVAEAIEDANSHTSPAAAEDPSPLEAAIDKETGIEAQATVEVSTPTADESLPLTEEPLPEEPVIESAVDLQQYVPEIDTQEPLHAATESFGDIQADDVPPAEYTETVTDNTNQQQQEQDNQETPVYTEEHELNQQPEEALEAAPEQAAEPRPEAAAEPAPEMPVKPAPEEEAIEEDEAVIDFTEGVIVTAANIPAAKEEVETTPEFFAEAAAEPEVQPNAVALAEQSLMRDENKLTEEENKEEEDAEPSGDLLPYQILDTTNEMPAAEAIDEPPVTGATLTEETVKQESDPQALVAEEPVSTDITALEEPVMEKPVKQEPETAIEEAVQQQPETTPEELAPTEITAQEASVSQAPPVEEPVQNEPVQNEPVAEPAPQPNWKPGPVFTPANKEPKTAIDTEEPIFESYHTIDYFASQGIKLREADYKDKLGKQLKSFTEWLRSMKRIVPTETNASLDEVTNQSIVRQAEHSVEEKEVITEAMAEVWAKQGHPKKAIAVYEKLSLLNPGKSPYFAGRIEQLKAL